MPAVVKQLTTKYYLDQANSNSVDESSLERLDSNEKLKHVEQLFMIPNPTFIEISTEPYDDSLFETNSIRRDLPTVFDDHYNEFDSSKLTDLDCFTVM